MKNETSGISRRSFLKRSTVAILAASNMMMFAGLVNAAEESSSFQIPIQNCLVKMERVQETFPGGVKRVFHKCTIVNDSLCGFANLKIPCGIFSYDPFDGKPLQVPQKVDILCSNGANALCDIIQLA
jgi:hypothetical protein